MSEVGGVGGGWDGETVLGSEGVAGRSGVVLVGMSAGLYCGGKYDEDVE